MLKEISIAEANSEVHGLMDKNDDMQIGNYDM